MIERVVIAGADVALEDVFASVTIRHGRGSVDDGPLASTATLTLVNVTRAFSSSFRTADDLEILLAADEPRFRGRITDASFSDGTLSIIAVSSLSWLARRPVGLEDFPEETWSARVGRVLREAEALEGTWENAEGTWADATGTWAEAYSGLVVEVGDHDPLVAARPADPTTLGAYLAELVETNSAAIAQLPSGAILVQELSARKGRTTVDLDPDLVLADPEWAMVDEVTNRIDLEWAGGEVTSTDPLSSDRFEERAESITTELALEEDAEDRADREVARRAWPRWEISRADLLALDATLSIGDPVSISSLEDGAPASTYVGTIEGWEDHVDVGPDTDDDGERDLEWRMLLSLSHPRLSGIGLAWEGMPAEETWADAPIEATWLEPELALAD